MILVAVGCGRISGILDIIKKQSFVVFGTMDENVLSHFGDCTDRILNESVHFYETG